MPKIMSINDKVTKRMNKIKKEKAEKEGKFLSYAGIIEMLLKETGRWKLSSKPKSTKKKESKE